MPADSINPDIIVATIFFGVLIVGAAIVIASELLAAPGRRLNIRIEAIRERWSPNQSIVQAVRVKRGAEGQGRLEQTLKRLVPNPAELRKRLAKTGLSIELGHYVATSLVLVVLATTGVALFFQFSALLSILSGITVGVGLPHMLTGKLIDRRISRFTRQFPEAIDLMVRGLRSGLPISESMNSVGQEIEDPVGIEFRRIVDAIKLGKDQNQALMETAERVDTADFRFFMISLSIQKETGGNLAETLDNLSDILRRRQQMKLKIKAMSSEARASAMIIGSLPFIMVGILMLVNYDYVSTLFTDPRGMMMSGFGLFMMALGGGVISKMVKFEI